MPTTVTRYVNTASSGGNGTTNATSGTNAAYATLSAWNTAEAKNLVTADEAHVVICEGGEDTVTSTINLVSGWTTDSTRTLTIKSNESRSATTFASGYRLRSATASATPLVLVAYTTLENFRVITSTSSGTTDCVAIDAAARLGIVIDRCWFRKTSTGSGGCFVMTGTTDGSHVTIRNSILDCTNSGGTASQYGIWATFTNNSSLFVRNCTITGFNGGGANSAGLRRDSTMTTFTVTNCAVFNNADDILGTAPDSLTYCAGDDTEFQSGTGNVNISPGGTESTDWNSAFTDYANGDYTVKNSSSLLYNAGTNLSGSGVTVDHIGTSRPQSTSFDIGAFELVVAGGPRRIRPATIIASQSATISGTASKT